MLIRISTRATVCCGRQPVSDPDTLRAVNGAESQERCGDYLVDDLADLGVTGGTVKLVRDAAAGGFRVVTEYSAPDRLTDAQLAKLVPETLGQWSDGIGEHCFDDLMRVPQLEIGLSDAPEDVRVEQVDDGRVVPRPPAALLKAAREGRTAELARLLDGGADIESRSRGWTLLHMAIANGHAAAALELLRRGADPNARDDRGMDPLMLTALSNRITDDDAALVARALLELTNQGDRTAALGVNEPRDRHTPLFMALNRNKAKLAAVLREFGAIR